VILADGVAVMAPGGVPALVAIYGAVLVAGCALALFAQLQCSARCAGWPVLGEAAEINEAVNRQRQP
jgi:hypothetical protein